MEYRALTTGETLDKGPMIMVHRGWLPWRKPRAFSSSLSCPVSPGLVNEDQDEAGDVGMRLQEGGNQDFQFINTTKPNQAQDVRLQRKVRRHARNQRERASRFSINSAISTLPVTTKSPARNIYIFTSTSQSVTIPVPLGTPTSLTTFLYPLPFALSPFSPETHTLLSSYLIHASTRMFPLFLSRILTSNPFRSPDWFQYAVTDSAMLSAILYSASVYMYLLTRDRKSEQEMLRWQARTMSVVQERLDWIGTTEVEDSTLGAISCLALCEAVLGNQELWGVHMRGLRHLLTSRSRASAGISASVPLSIEMEMRRLSPNMRAKLRRSDITGALDYNLSPYLSSCFHPLQSSSSESHTWSYVHDEILDALRTQLASILSSLLPPSSQLFSTMTALVHFIYAIHFATTSSIPISIDPHTFSTDLYSIESALLTSSPTSSLNQNPITKGTETALRLSSLLYLKSILQEFPHSLTGPRILLSQLLDSLRFLLTIPHTEAHYLSPIICWISTIGALLSSDEKRQYFIDILVSTQVGKGTGWEIPQQESLESILSLSRVFGTGALNALRSEVACLVEREGNVVVPRQL